MPVSNKDSKRKLRHKSSSNLNKSNHKSSKNITFQLPKTLLLLPTLKSIQTQFFKEDYNKVQQVPH
jgi:hypothetical protein